ncbi:MAG: Rieske 2Fe-2S domain-containing protein, partial [Nitrospinaceae bacterium]|nr:Rieske 2Fe-2S domain-containing protein [Nitrospinaceae bacterium]NIR55277.1 Rieske 2Fe-2S domain-containing protein [Nitrospinaceae bacterium]NIS85715.1 Rieske 2Fe-2S domain-containing protein [Nitrospinaceae bacterium]NIT82566.1 Rieske 2Fe-2S domain-containing protein [Nitrospinaceae bacterium]NIU44770.1 Rieske 2Fe-2S domain-containing protein [Nitrospinaceae bacterium]
LGEGRIEEGVVICPNHEWRFELETGNNLQNPNLKTGCYPVRVRGESLYIGFRKEEKKLLGKDASALPSTIKWKIP